MAGRDHRRGGAIRLGCCAHDEARWLLLGETDAERRLALIFTRRGNQLRPISCRPMRRNERRLYDDAKAKLEGGSEEGR